MIGFLVRKIFGSKNDRFLKKLRPLVAKINALEPEMQALADEELPQRLAVYREQVQNGEKDLDAVLPEVFALVREASTRVLGMRHYDVQLLGAMALHNGKIAEMKTGEGKTLVATLAVILNSLEGKGVHVVTVNDYLAKRDAEWMGRLYNFLGLSVGVIVAGLSDEQRKEAYGADITYGTNNEFGFDYLRDNMKFYAEQLVQRGHHYAIVDEVDSILIDEARTPLIISGASDESTDLYQKVDEVVRTLEKEKHYTVDEKGKTASLTDEGVLYVEEQLGIENLYDTANITAQHHVLQSLKAHTVFRRDVDYIVKDDQVEIRRGKSKPEIITKKSQPRAFAFASLMRNLAGADAKTLGNWFTVSSISGTASGWTVTLKPSRDPLRQAFDTVTIKGGDAVTGVSFLSPAKDRTRIRFDDVHVNEGGLADAEERLSR